MTNVAYYSSCTSPTGWASRPDGYIVCLNKEFLQKKVEELNSLPRDSPFGYDTYDNPKLCIVTEEMYGNLINNPGCGYVWAPNNRSTWLVEE